MSDSLTLALAPPQWHKYTGKMQQSQVDVRYDKEPSDDQMELNFGALNAAFHNALGYEEPFQFKIRTRTY